MFRRKEESATDFSADTAGQTAAPAASNGAHAAHESAAVSSAAPASAPASQQTTSTHSYTPSPASAPRSAPSASASYRPSPVAEFSRNAARATEAARPASMQASSSFSSASEKSASTHAKPNRRVLTVGNDILLKGEIATCDRLVIEGRVEAKLSDVHTVEIAECGSFKGTAEVEDAEISGLFEGDLVVRNRLVIYTTGEVRGNISYGEIEIERGGKLTGQIKTVAQGSKGKTLDLSDSSKTRSKETVAA